MRSFLPLAYRLVECGSWPASNTGRFLRGREIAQRKDRVHNRVMAERDEVMRVRCFLALDALRARYGNDLPFVGALSEGFVFSGRRIPFLNRQKGIYRSASQKGPAALSIQTSFKSPYGDEETGDGFRYAYRAGSIDQPDNRALRQAHVLGVPIAYFVSTRPGWYRAEYPCYITEDNPNGAQVLVTPGRMRGTLEDPEPAPIEIAVERTYAVRETRARLHQGRFRAHSSSRLTATAALSAAFESFGFSMLRTSSRTSIRRDSRRSRTG
jgi:hypothetical protein